MHPIYYELDCICRFNQVSFSGLGLISLKQKRTIDVSLEFLYVNSSAPNKQTELIFL